MDLSFLMNNPIAIAVGSALGGSLVGSIAKLAYDKLSVRDFLAKKERGLGNFAGLQAKKYLLDPIKDPQTRELAKAELRQAPNDYDEGWDAGLEGIVL